MFKFAQDFYEIEGVDAPKEWVVRTAEKEAFLAAAQKKWDEIGGESTAAKYLADPENVESVVVDGVFDWFQLFKEAFAI